jgi:hypothetical protein
VPQQGAACARFWVHSVAPAEASDESYASALWASVCRLLTGNSPADSGLASLHDNQQ